jgi:hypothetical protein
MRKKKLDKLFQEKLKNFSEVPDEKVWQAIETSLDGKKKSRRIIPFWWLGGAAALLAVAIWVINPFEGANVSPTVVESEKNDSAPESNPEINAPNKVEKMIQKESGIANSDQQAQDDAVSENGSAIIKNSSEKEVADKSNANFKQEILKKSSEMAESKQTNSSNSKGTVLQFDQSPQDVIASSERNKVNEVGAEKTDPPLNKTPQRNFEALPGLSEQEETKIAEVDEKKDEVKIKEDKRKSIFDEIKDQEEEAIAENDGNRWSAGPSIAPVYFNSFGEGSPIHSIFVPNSKTGDLNMSYGLSVAYEINSRMKIRSGVHKVDFGYDTNEVGFSSSLESADAGRIDNIDYNATSRNLVVQSNAAKINATTSEFAQNASDVSAISTVTQNGVMSQQFGYLEIPVELEYALIDNKLGVNLIGGFSSLFLVDNMVSLSSGNLTTEMGEANNLNNLNFSTNIGLGLNYNFTKNIALNIDPVFKYQLNTFSQTDGTFRPFSIGVYSGLNFRF